MAEVAVRDWDRQNAAAYVVGRADEKVVHLEKVASEMVDPVRHEIWDSSQSSDVAPRQKAGGRDSIPVPVRASWPDGAPGGRSAKA